MSTSATPTPVAQDAGSGRLQDADLARLALEATHDGVVIIGPDRTVLAFNQRFATMCRVPEEALHSRRADLLLAAIAPQLEAPAPFLRRLRRLDASEAAAEELLRFLDGRVFVLRTEPAAGADGEWTGRTWCFRDVTGRARAENLLEETAQQYEHLMRQAHAAIFELDLHSARFVSVNDVMCELTGYSKDELLRMGPLDLVAEDERPKFEERWSRFLEGDPPEETVLYRWHRKDGRVSWAVSSLKVVPVGEGEPHLVGVALDVGARERAEQDRRRMREELLRAQKHESLSVMAAGIAHDFNNLLQVITGNAELLACDVLADGRSGSAVAQIRKAATRATELSQQMLTFAGQLESVRQEVHLAELVKTSWSLLRGMVAEQTSLHLEIEPAPSVQAHAGQLERVLINLVNNAAEAIPSGKPGTIVVRVGRADGVVPPSLPHFPAHRSALGPCAALEVEDNGSGMDVETVRRAFDPFFTTKFTGRGLGLAMVLGIVRAPGGQIVVDSRPDQGSLMRVLLPVEAGQSRAAEPSP